MTNHYELIKLTNALIEVCQMEEVDVTPYLEKILSLKDMTAIRSALSECKERLGQDEYEFLLDMVLESALENLSGDVEFRNFQKQNSLAFRALAVN
jgi:hypothetical protein